jgi:hypothetical protein
VPYDEITQETHTMSERFVIIGTGYLAVDNSVWNDRFAYDDEFEARLAFNDMLDSGHFFYQVLISYNKDFWHIEDEVALEGQTSDWSVGYCGKDCLPEDYEFEGFFVDAALPIHIC